MQINLRSEIGLAGWEILGMEPFAWGEEGGHVSTGRRPRKGSKLEWIESIGDFNAT